jgi:hypothetical protein
VLRAAPRDSRASFKTSPVADTCWSVVHLADSIRQREQAEEGQYIRKREQEQLQKAKDKAAQAQAEAVSFGSDALYYASIKKAELISRTRRRRSTTLATSRSACIIEGGMS